MAFFGRKTVDDALETAALALHRAGEKVAGDRGAAVAARVSDAVLGRHFEFCSAACGWCNDPSKGGH
ncbi:hypothetical protein [Streptomyces albipurpureus]|uniref:Uncharacterized protein n=1 Tax=Streptomyces albipurpureus TaxID=2897419 RepID=A0ABT0UX90_9ACTN|nr:hypothetical protein [Streptomyces sp. CWNU-1]MCM2393074.1 hypothetical protein [Streptomyces sp. CWNU-1]